MTFPRLSALTFSLGMFLLTPPAIAETEKSSYAYNTPNIACNSQQVQQTAYRCLRHGKYEAARIVLDAALLREPNDPCLRRYRAHAFLNLGFTSRARQDIDHVIARGLERPEDHLLQGDISYYQGHYDQAILSYYTALGHTPCCSHATVGAARAHMALGQHNRAESLCRRYLTSSTGNRKAVEKVLDEVRKTAPLVASKKIYGG